MSQPKPLSDYWEAFRANMLPINAGAERVEECKLAFHAGAAATYREMGRLFLAANQELHLRMDEWLEAQP